MFDHVERRAFLIHPAREDAFPIAVGAPDIELDKCPGEPLGFPRRGRIAGAKPDQRVLGADRLAGLQREIADDPVALVEQGDHRHPLGHRCDPGGVDRRRQRFGNDFIVGRGVVRPLVARSDHQAERGNSEGAAAAHALSGVHAL